MRRLPAVFLLLLSTMSVAADSTQFEYAIAPRILGLSLGARYIFTLPTVDGVETSAIALLSGAYEGSSYYRLPDGTLFMAEDGGYGAESALYDRVDLVWEFGVQQGILPGADELSDMAVAFAFYRGQYDHPFEQPDLLYFDAALPESDGGLLGSINVGLAFSNTRQEPITHVIRGVHTEVALEWGPSFLHNQILGNADFGRTTLNAMGYIPLLGTEPRDGMNRFASYLALMTTVDWAYGPSVPDSVRSSTGGRARYAGLGGLVRGVEAQRFDATFKTALNAELRLNLPAILLPSIIPGIVLYTDVGYYNDIDQTSPIAGENSGTVVASGLGVSLDLLNALQLVFYTNYVWNQTDIEGDHWVPFSLGFGYHF